MRPDRGGAEELPDDLLRRELLSSWHLVPSLGLHHPEILSLRVATFKGGRSVNPFATNGTGGFVNGLDGGSFSVLRDGDSLKVVFTAVPEPATVALAVLGLATAACLRVLRRRRSSAKESKSSSCCQRRSPRLEIRRPTQFSFARPGQRMQQEGGVNGAESRAVKSPRGPARRCGCGRTRPSATQRSCRRRSRPGRPCGPPSRWRRSWARRSRR